MWWLGSTLWLTDIYRAARFRAVAIARWFTGTRSVLAAVVFDAV